MRAILTKYAIIIPTESHELSVGVFLLWAAVEEVCTSFDLLHDLGVRAPTDRVRNYSPWDWTGLDFSIPVGYERKRLDSQRRETETDRITNYCLFLLVSSAKMSFTPDIFRFEE